MKRVKAKRKKADDNLNRIPPITVEVSAFVSLLLDIVKHLKGMKQ